MKPFDSIPAKGAKQFADIQSAATEANTTVRVLAMMLIMLVTLNAQTEFFGYYESELDQFQFQDQHYNFGYNKLRLDLESRPSDQVIVGANLNLQRFFGKTTWNLFDFLPEKIWKPVFQPVEEPDSLWLTELLFTMRDTLYLDNVYLRAQFSRFDVTVGKQQISPGTGYAWNPTDIFNRKDLLDPTYEQTGINAIRLEAPLRDRISVDIIISPKESWETSTRMVQGKIGWGRFDFTGSYAEYEDLFPYWRLSTFAEGSSTRTSYKAIGGSFVGQIWELGLWGEGLRDAQGGLSDFDEYLIGFDHTFDFQAYILLEYYHNSAGANTGNLQFDDYFYYFSGETHSLMQDYLFVFLNQPITGFVSLGLFSIANLNDESWVINPQVVWGAYENVEVSLLYSYFIGDEDTEFGLQDSGWRLRIRAYF